MLVLQSSGEGSDVIGPWQRQKAKLRSHGWQPLAALLLDDVTVPVEHCPMDSGALETGLIMLN
jgi:hypothetical protein